MAQAPQPVTGALTGKEPAIFNGDRSLSDKFMREFNMYKSMNDTHIMMVNPYKRVVLALSLMQGPNIEDWVDTQLNDLNDKVTRAQNPIGRDEEQLWNEFKTTFEAAFTNTTKQQTAYHQLQNLKMQGSDLDNYVSTFKNLAKKAKFEEDAAATIHMFATNLQRGLLNRILDRETVPTTFNGWIEAARKEQQRFSMKQTMMQPMSKWPTTWNKPQHKTHRRNPNDETVPMDIDVVRRAVTEDDKKKHRDQGRCFECSRQGHMARECPNKKRQQSQARPTRDSSGKFQKKKKKFKPKSSFVRAIIEADSDDEDFIENFKSDDEEAEDKLDIPHIAARTAQFTDEQREQWAQEMRKQGVDFQ
jgi:hypothetical protein